ncbi:Egg cell-secreted protein 1.1 [Striga hermonthica]|uniref:Egg cell-secreted protein 1.1 n=1 Tax=Striga hermonthica TaxID=68872 RepID=A0A9N7MQT0_STRHE|nr:Egg cell-secreted protein 1.1 [Striga hermonthica]
MASYSSKLLLSLVLASLLVSSSTISARKINPRSTASTLSARLKLDQHNPDGTGTCWDALFELQSCSGEVVLFFLNGETQLGPACCGAIRTIEHECWPSMLGSLGITAEESDVLRGYCDATAARGGGSTGAPPPPPPPPPLLEHHCYGKFPRVLP